MPVRIIHVTSPGAAFRILEMRAYTSDKLLNNYDAGMNFLGVLGEYSNTQPSGRGAKIHCAWNGAASAPLPYDEFPHHVPNKLYDFNGSGEHFTNNDPRYFLPYGSIGLVVKQVEFDENALLQDWCQFKGRIYDIIFRLKIFNLFLHKLALRSARKLNDACATGELVIDVKRDARKT